MSFLDFLKSLFSPKPQYPTYETGVIPNDIDDRDIELVSVQKPVGAPDSYFDSGHPILSIYHFDQGQQPACVPHAIDELAMYYYFKKTGQRIILSPRFHYILCKSIDGMRSLGGTTPRAGALAIVKFGVCSDSLLLNDTSLTKADYLAPAPSQALYDDAKNHKLPGFAAVNPDIESIKEAIYQNGAITGTTIVGDWNSLPVRSTPPRGAHYTVWFGYEKTQTGDYKIYFKNSWGKGWLSWLLNWLYPGYGYFLWSEYEHKVSDILAFTDIPKEYLDAVKAVPYRFTYNLSLGDADPAVKELQKMLNATLDTCVQLDGPGSPGQETSYFGGQTKAALMKWQAKAGLPTTGFFGPQSIAFANKRLPHMTLEQAIILQESGGLDSAIGDKNLTHHAYGCMQIRQPAVDDVNKKLGTNYKAQDCLNNRDLSLKIFRTYCSIYEPNSGDEQKARLWNGGPGWTKKPWLTDAYWSSIRKKLNQ